MGNNETPWVNLGDYVRVGNLLVQGQLTSPPPPSTGSAGGAVLSVINADSVPLPFGTPVYVSAPGQVKRARADVIAGSVAIALVQDATIAPGASGNVVARDVLTGTAAQWDAVTGAVGGLQFGVIYYVSPTTPGMITGDEPGVVGEFAVQVGVALTSTVMELRIASPRPAVNSRFMFALWGQSNAFGQQGSANINNGQRASIGVAFPNVNLRQKSSQPPAADPIVWTTDSTASLSSYTATQNNNSGHGIDGTGIGPAQSMGRHFDYYKQNKADISCVGVSGASLAVHWNPTGAYPAAGPNLFAQAIATTNSAMASFGSKPGGFFWVQGETDADNAIDAGNYQANLTAFFAAVRAAYGPTFPIVFAQLSVHSVAAFAATVRAAQAAVAAATPNCTMVVTDDIPLGGDGTHYTADGYAALGDRMSAEMITLLAWAPPVTAWHIDRFSLIGIPQTAAEWNAVLAAALIGTGGPARLYLLQEAAGAVVDTIGGINMAPNGAGMHYRSPVLNGDWEAKSVKFDNGTFDAFTTNNAALPDPATTSWCRLMYAVVATTPGAVNMYIIGTAGFEALATNAGGGGTNWQLSDGGNTVVGPDNVCNYEVRPFVHLRSLTGLGAPRVDAYTDNAHIQGVVGPVVGKFESIGCAFGNPLQQAVMCVEWDGAAADLITAEVRTVLQLLNWGNANLGATPIPW